ncbi:family 43 glycosylhydrolase [Saccharicrinis fermentans]|uniref:Beta-xylosidase n=1 Tax=Saccharicrinis fermentans DSM 9555 = JCM 21142 TaxID=869213 RepID=W7YST1_9BACT|nr:family 43 glycosylhydrolase [Saccharicrinis fermentans]GAF05524.1 beta-xylosidase [Saccharicrinis fermentans DSM 9555 = JCM 21142]
MKNILYIVILLLFIQCKSDSKDKLLVPKQENKFVWIYKPAGDYFFGPDTEFLKEGQWYDEWVPNDHTFVKGEDGKWHIFGITHPLVMSDPLSKGIHDGEYASFHAISSKNSFKESVEEYHYKDLPKILSPQERPGEILANHAPYIIKNDGFFQMVYGHSPIRLAVSSDLMNWKPKGNLFSLEDGKGDEKKLFGDARDPNLLYHEGTYYIVYCSTKSVRMRISKNLKAWSEEKIILRTESYDPESPSLIFYNNTFYLFVCSWDGIWDQKEIVGAYQHKTYVLQSDDILDFGKDHEKEVTVLNAHAPEIFQDEEGQWYISSVEWPNRGVSVDKLWWE